MGFPIKDNLISYYSDTDKYFVLVGKEPLDPSCVIPQEDVAYN